MNKEHPPLDIHRKLVELSDCGRPFALALILKADGSTPQKAGVKAIIDGTGKIWGTLGGGVVEANAQRHAREACQSGHPIVFDLHLADAYAKDAGPICGGSMRILIAPTASEYRQCYEQAADALKLRRQGVLLTRVRNGQPVKVTTQWFAKEAVPWDIGFPGAEAVCSCLDNETPRLFVDNSEMPGGSTEVLVEPVIPKPLLLIVGGGHVGQALSLQAILNGFDVMVMDDRPEFTNPVLFADDVRTRCGDIPKEVAGFPIDKDTYVVLVTRGHKQDAEALEACIHAPAAYVGMIGSRRKVAMIRKHFIESGLATEEAFNRVFAPIGLDIGAVTVPEIATSIMAQMIAVRRKGPAYSPAGHMVPQ